MELFQLASQSVRNVSDLGFSDHAVARRAGVASTRLRELVFSQTLALIDEFLGLEGLCTQHAASLQKMLERFIGTCLPRDVSHELIHLRRDIFNDRSPKRQLSEKARTSLQEARLALEVESWLASRGRREELMKHGESLFTQELSAKRDRLKCLLRNNEFRKAVAMASPELSRELDQYIRSTGPQSVARVRRTERSLLRYYSRSALKLSPFSSFTRTGVVMANRVGSTRADSTIPSQQRIRRYVTVNRSLVSYIANRVASHDELGGWIPIFANRAFTDVQDSILVLRHRYRDVPLPVRLRVPDEGLVSIRRTRAVDWVLRFLKLNGGAVVRQQLTSALEKLLGDQLAATDYVGGLVEAGLLIHKVPLPEGNSSGLDALISFLATLPCALASGVTQSLEELRSVVGHFSAAGPSVRPHLMAAMDQIVSKILSALGEKSPASWNGLLLYEDCVEEKIGTLHITEEHTEALRHLSGFASTYLRILDGNLSARETIRHVLLKEFAGGPVPFLRFAEQYKRVCFPVAGTPENLEYEFTPNPCKLDSLRNLAKIREEIVSTIVQESDEEELDLTEIAQERRWQERFRELGLSPSAGSSDCFSCYFQPVRDRKNRSMIVLNKVHGGPARVALRFCSGLKDCEERVLLLASVRRLLRRLWGDAEPCELLASFDFNVNLHPPVTERLIDYCNVSTGGLPAVHLSDLSIMVGNDSQIVLFDEKSQREIVPVTFGMMATPFEPPLEYLLLSLGGADPVMYQPFDPYSWHVGPAMRGPIVRFPRLAFGRCIVRRLGWSIVREALPVRTQDESDFRYFLRVRRWQKSIGLPDEVFMRARTRGESFQGSLSGKRNRHVHKPQYIHFGNHFTLDVMTDLFREATSHVYVEEMLPDWNSLDKSELSRPVELVLDVLTECERSLRHAGRQSRNSSDAHVLAS